MTTQQEKLDQFKALVNKPNQNLELEFFFVCDKKEDVNINNDGKTEIVTCTIYQKLPHPPGVERKNYYRKIDNDEIFTALPNGHIFEYTFRFSVDDNSVKILNYVGDEKNLQVIQDFVNQYLNKKEQSLDGKTTLETVITPVKILEPDNILKDAETEALKLLHVLTANKDEDDKSKEINENKSNEEIVNILKTAEEEATKILKAATTDIPNNVEHDSESNILKVAESEILKLLEAAKVNAAEVIRVDQRAIVEQNKAAKEARERAEAEAARLKAEQETQEAELARIAAENAATKLSAVVRGRMGRKKVTSLKDARAKAEEEARILAEEEARLKAEEEAATKLGALAKGNLARQKYKAAKEARERAEAEAARLKAEQEAEEAELARIAAENAATKLSAVVRGRMGRKKVTSLKDAQKEQERKEKEEKERKEKEEQERKEKEEKERKEKEKEEKERKEKEEKERKEKEEKERKEKEEKEAASTIDIKELKSNMKDIQHTNQIIQAQVNNNKEPLLAPFRDDIEGILNEKPDNEEMKVVTINQTLKDKTDTLTKYTDENIKKLFDLFNDGFKYIFAIPIQHKNLNLFLNSLFTKTDLSSNQKKQGGYTKGGTNTTYTKITDFYKDIISLMFIDGSVQYTSNTKSEILNKAMNVDTYPYKVTDYHTNYSTFLANFEDASYLTKNSKQTVYPIIYNIVDIIIMYKYYFSAAQSQNITYADIRFYLALRLYTFFKYLDKNNMIFKNPEMFNANVKSFINTDITIENALGINDNVDENKPLTLKQIIQNINKNKILTIIKINNYTFENGKPLHAHPYHYNRARYEPFLNKQQTSMLLAYKNDTIKYFNKNEDYIEPGKEIKNNDIEYGLFGPFNHIFGPKDTNEQMANHDIICKDNDPDADNNNILSLINKGKNVFMLGYGSSGAGKTRSLFGGIEKVNGEENIEKGIVSHMVEKLASKNKFSVRSYEFYMKENTEGPRNFQQNENLLSEYKIGDKDNGHHLIAKVRQSMTFEWKVVDQKKKKGYYILTNNEVNTFNHDTRGNDKEPAKSFVTNKNYFENVMNYIISENRLERPTMNNPNSSRSHVISIFSFEQEGGNEKGKLIIGDLAGVENTFNENSIHTLKKFHDNHKISKYKDSNSSPESIPTYPIEIDVEQKYRNFEIQALLQFNDGTKNKLHREMLNDLIRNKIIGTDKAKILLRPIDKTCILNDKYTGDDYEIKIAKESLLNVKETPDLINTITSFIKEFPNNFIKEFPNNFKIDDDAMYKNYDFQKSLVGYLWDLVHEKEAPKPKHQNNSLTPESDNDIFTYRGYFIDTKVINSRSSAMEPYVISGDRYFHQHKTTHGKILAQINYDTSKILDEKVKCLSKDGITNFVNDYKTLNDINENTQSNKIYKILFEKLKTIIKHITDERVTKVNKLINAANTYITNTVTAHIDKINHYNKEGIDGCFAFLYSFYYITYTPFITQNYQVFEAARIDLIKNVNSILKTHITDYIQPDLVNKIKVRDNFIKISVVDKFAESTIPFNTFIKSIPSLQKMVKERKFEGYYINEDLRRLREDINTYMITKSGGHPYTLPLLENSCNPEYCNDTMKCFTIMNKNTSTIEVNSVIMNIIRKTISSEPAIEAFYKNIQISIFTVFNIRRGTDNPPNTPYINVNKLKKLINSNSNKDTVNDAIKKELKKIVEDIRSTDPNKNFAKDTMSIQNHSSFKEIISNMNAKKNITNNMISKLVDIIDNHNSTTTLGTLTFTDSLAKFGTTNHICETSETSEDIAVNYNHVYVDDKTLQVFKNENSLFDVMNNQTQIEAAKKPKPKSEPETPTISGRQTSKKKEKDSALDTTANGMKRQTKKNHR